ncbi:MAG: ribosomal protein L11 methyltransferase [Alphaproteobacteria bacterium]|jgi:ribosomal protein L11 methyltransferase
MAWQQIKINVESHQAEALGELLTELEAHAVTFVDAKDTPMYEPKPGEILLWPDTQVIGLYGAQDDLTWIIKAILEAFQFIDATEIIIDQLEDKNWEREWMENFHPMKFGKRLWICPSWHEIPDISAVNIMLDPGLAFGTGTHPTTRLCLQWLDGIDLVGKVVVDFGCGSGILAIAALKLGAKEVIGIDLDPQALLASADNAKRNGVEGKLNLYLPQNQPKLEADVVIANILSAPLKELSETITDYCKESGMLVMSGILQEQYESVVQVYENQFDFDPVAIEGEWVRLSAVKKIQ